MSKRRRAHGNGSIERVSEAKYQIRYELPRVGEHGSRRRRKELIFGTKTAATERLRTRLAEVHSGAYPDEDRLTFKSLVDRYLVEKAISKEATTVAWYRRHLTQHVLPTLGHLMLRDIRAHDIRTLIVSSCNRSRTTRRGEPLGPKSRRNLLIAIRAILAWAVKQGYIARNEGDRVEMPSIPYVERVDIEIDTVRRLLEASSGSELEAIVAVAIGTGLRRSELCALRWSDVDLTGGTVRVQRAAANLDGKVIIKAPKTKRSQRIDHIPAFVLAVLRRLRAAQASRHLALGLSNRGPEGVIFDRYDGRAWDPNELSRSFSRFVRKHKLPAIRFHDLRHGYATLAFASGSPLKTVSESLGHSSIAVTASIYVHILDEAKREKAARLDVYLESAVAALR